MGGKYIFWFEELSAADNNLVGKKCANLGELTRGGFHVPAGYALSVDAYSRFMNESGAKDDVVRYLALFSADPDNLGDAIKFEEAAKAIRGIVESKKMPPDMEQAVKEHYAGLCQRNNREETPVATRSAGPASHPGQYETYLHVKGMDDVVHNVIRVWSSTFNARSLIARARLHLPLEDDPIGVAVLTMVEAYSAGVMFTLDPVSGDKSVVSIDAAIGLGEAVVSGLITPDQYLVDKVGLGVVERHVHRKEMKYERHPLGRGIIYCEVSEEEKEKPALLDSEIKELAQIGMNIEKHYGTPMDIEWAVTKKSASEHGTIYIVQARPETVWSKKAQTATSSTGIADALLKNLLQ
jgi:pyruvate,water dikinase